jgi:hypothetical protein
VSDHIVLDNFSIAFSKDLGATAQSSEDRACAALVCVQGERGRGANQIDLNTQTGLEAASIVNLSLRAMVIRRKFEVLPRLN